MKGVRVTASASGGRRHDGVVPSGPYRRVLGNSPTLVNQQRRPGNGYFGCLSEVAGKQHLLDVSNGVAEQED
jgi:hypothetical protein